MVRRLYGDSLASGQQEKDNDQRTEKGLPVRRQLPLQSVHVRRRLWLQSLHLQALQLLRLSYRCGRPREVTRGGASAREFL